MSSQALVLGLETSCDETAASVVLGGRTVLSNIVASQHDLHAEYGGVVPEIASRAHVERVLPTVRAAVEQSGAALEHLDAVAVGHRPGLIGSLVVGLSAAKGLAWSLGVPLIGVDHVHAHLYAGLLGREDADVYPALGLVVSGGHSTIYRVEDPISFTRLGATIDDAMGEAYDKAATILGLGHPGGPAVDRLAQEDPTAGLDIELPVSRLGKESLDFSFSGLKTALLYKVRGTPRPKRDGGGFERSEADLTAEQRRGLASAFQRAACRAVVLKLERAIEREPQKPVTLVAGGGVTANSRLRAELAAFAERHGLELVLPPMDLCVDNAAMVAGLGAAMLERGFTSGLDLPAVPSTAC